LFYIKKWRLENYGFSVDFYCFSAKSAWKITIKKSVPFWGNRLIFCKSVISFLQKRKIAKARAQGHKGGDERKIPLIFL